jgi:hypothetical protein
LVKPPSIEISVKTPGTYAVIYKTLQISAENREWAVGSGEWGKKSFYFSLWVIAHENQSGNVNTENLLIEECHHKGMLRNRVRLEDDYGLCSQSFA